MFPNLRHLGIKPEKYIRFVFLPLSVLALIFVILALLLLQSLIELIGLFALIFYAVPGLIFAVAILYPKIIEGRMRNEIDNNIHFYITHMGALATSEIDRVEMMKIISQRKEYKALAEETRKIYLLMDRWNRNLAQACRFIARRTPSNIFSDFLDRMAHELDSGEDFKEFIRREQKVVMDEFSTHYSGKLYSIDVFKELYVSMVLSLAFFAAFAIIMPFLTGMNVLSMMYLIMLFFILTEAGVITYLKGVAPQDPVWQTSGELTSVDAKLFRWTYIGISLTLATFTIIGYINYVLNLTNIPFPFILAISVTPLILPGIKARNEEKEIRDKDRNAPSFIMSLGASASARGGNILESLKYLTSHDFGKLTDDVRALYKRLNTRINKVRAWQKFSIGTNSNLIYRFMDMFTEAIGIGSDPKDVATIVATNFNLLNSLRAKRSLATGSFVGISYGVTIGIAFSLYISFGVVESLSQLYASLGAVQRYIGNILHAVQPEDLSFIDMLVFIILLIHSAVSSLAIKIMDGGRFIAGLPHFVGMVWFAAAAGYVSKKLITDLLVINSIT
jgi:flagellar protein FlaJ